MGDGPLGGASAFGDALAAGARKGLPEPAPDVRVAAAFALGWQLAILYRPECRAAAVVATEADLPNVGRLTDEQLVGVGLDRVQVSIHGLGPLVGGAGLAMPDVAAVRAQLDAGATAAGRRDLIRTLHLQLYSTLGAVDFRLGKAYGIGRALADTCRNPETLDDLARELAPARVTQLASWLSDLASGFPAHAARSVNASLRRWEAWVEQQSSEPVADDVYALLRRQGELWRSLLAGEKLGTDMLCIDDYIAAAERLASHTRTLCARFLGRFWGLAAVVLAFFAGGVALVVIDASSASVVAGTGAVLTSVGLTWRGIGSTVGRVVGGLERPLWGAELDAAITEAITLLPAEAGG